MANGIIINTIPNTVKNVHSTLETGSFQYTINAVPAGNYLFLYRIELQTTGHVKLMINGGIFANTDYSNVGFVYGWDAVVLNSGSVVISSDSNTTAKIKQIFIMLLSIRK